MIEKQIQRIVSDAYRTEDILMGIIFAAQLVAIIFIPDEVVFACVFLPLFFVNLKLSRQLDKDQDAMREKLRGLYAMSQYSNGEVKFVVNGIALWEQGK